MIKSLSREQPDRPCSEPFIMWMHETMPASLWTVCGLNASAPSFCGKRPAISWLFYVRGVAFMLCSTMFCPYVHRLRWNMVER
jgi:vacuolar-type H+-ATPase subunit I/STV1